MDQLFVAIIDIIDLVDDRVDRHVDGWIAVGCGAAASRLKQDS